MPRLFVLAVLLALSVSDVYAGVYKCKGADGTVTFSDKACGDSPQVVNVQAGHPGTASSKSWTFSKRIDDMTGKTTCVADSPDIYLGSDNSKSFYFAKLRVINSDGKPSVAIEGTEAFKEHGDSIHNDVSNLGLKIGERFFAADKKINSSMLLLSTDDAPEIVELLRKNIPMRIRLRFWPYDQVYDNKVAVSATGFAAAYDQAVTCK